ncbi:MAG: rhomboid family intramembrane serine protease, partial [Limisphaerales bacterium]
MQQPWSGWAILLTINVVVFILQVMIDPGSLDSRFGNSLVGQWFAVDSAQISWLLPMQLITYQFFHGSVFHILVNALGLFFIG